MKIPLNIFMAGFLLIAWGFGISQISIFSRTDAVIASVLMLLIVVAVCGITSNSKNEKIEIDMGSDPLYRDIEHAPKKSGLFLSLLAIALGIFLIVGVLALMIFGPKF